MCGREAGCQQKAGQQRVVDMCFTRLQLAARLQARDLRQLLLPHVQRLQGREGRQGASLACGDTSQVREARWDGQTAANAWQRRRGTHPGEVVPVHLQQVHMPQLRLGRQAVGVQHLCQSDCQLGPRRQRQHASRWCEQVVAHEACTATAHTHVALGRLEARPLLVARWPRPGHPGGEVTAPERHPGRTGCRLRAWTRPQVCNVPRRGAFSVRSKVFRCAFSDFTRCSKNCGLSVSCVYHPLLRPMALSRARASAAMRLASATEGRFLVGASGRVRPVAAAASSTAAMSWPRSEPT